MLPERYVRLLTAYVDGELSAHHSRLARRLLRRSSRARALFKQLRANAERIHKLPRHELGESFIHGVMEKIARPAAAVPATPAASSLSSWAAAAMAASILLAVASAAFLLFDPAGNDAVSKKKEDELLPLPVPRAVLPGTRIALSDPTLDRELAKTNALHLEISCRDRTRAVAELKDSFMANGIQLVVDAAADLSGDFLVYAENLQGEELAEILRGQSQFDAVFVNPLDEQDRRTMAGRFGVAPQAFAPPPRFEMKKMIRKGEAPPSGTPEKRADRIAVVLADAGMNAALSDELQRFVQQRRPQPGTLQVVLVLHELRA